MKVIHILKKMENIDEDIKDLRKVENSIKKNKSFSTPIYMSIEKQINILLGDKIRLLELKIENPPPELIEEIEGEPVKDIKPHKITAKKTKPKKTKATSDADENLEQEIGILTQDMVDSKFNKIQSETQKESNNIEKEKNTDSIDNDSMKLLDVALEKGTLSNDGPDSDKKKVRFFKDNFPGGE